ncbi:MAG TPA: LiaF-related protein [Chloroflexota bacterium]|nr:LiaF-related protein [Chloroflexota bacterium]HUM71843.1 LiaF-related protein [Chloroflexota bacterium]
MAELKHEERQHRSLFGPIVLIAIGLFLLFNQVNPVTDLHWLDVLRLWPLMLVFLGLNILVLQAPRPYSAFLSGLIAVIAVLVFGYVLLYGLGGRWWGSRSSQTVGDWQSDTVQFAAPGVDTAVYHITIGPPGADLYALEDSRQLIAGTVYYQDDYLFETDVKGDAATIRLAPEESSERWVFWPNYWQEYGEANRWQIGISPQVLAALTLETVAGAAHIDLRDLQLSALTATTNAAEAELLLPGGDYDAALVNNATSTEITLPADGRHAIDLQVNAGAVTLHLPAGMAAQVTVNQALGSFAANNPALQPVAGKENVWQTAGYKTADDRVDLIIQINVGSVTMD